MTTTSNLFGGARTASHRSQRSVVVYIDESPRAGRYTFIATGASARRPSLLEADDLRSALKISKKLEFDQQGHAPMPILLVDATSVSEGPPLVPGTGDGVDSARGRAVRSLPSPRAIASLLLDCTLIGLADGAVVAVDPGRISTATLLVELVRILRSRGIRVNTEIDGWELRSTSRNSDIDGDIGRADDHITIPRG